MRRRFLLGALGLAAAPGAMRRSFAAYPEDRPITLIVGVPPGGAVDVLARLLAAKLGAQLGKSVVVVNRPGGSFAVSVNAMRSARPDGHTLLFANGGYAVVSALPKAGFDIAADFAPVSGVATGPLLLIARRDMPGDLGALTRLARENPGKLTFGSGGIGTLFHLAGELFQKQADIRMLHVPYSGSGPAYQDMLAGRLDLMFDTTAAVVGQINAGQLRGIAVATPRRLDVLPAIPTFAETGLPGFDPSQWFGLVAPAGTAPDIVARLAAEVATAVAQPDVRERLAAQGNLAAAAGPEAFQDMLRRTVARWREVIRDARLEFN
jgi:tripartite-type tricarboxylate transporter receptor subunit TctC